MTRRRQSGKRAHVSVLFAILLFGMGAAPSTLAASDTLSDLLGRTGQQVSKFVEQFSEVKCTEKVTQEKLGKEDKVEVKEESTYDYLVILSNAGGELGLDESRLAVREAKPDKKNTVPAGDQRLRHPVSGLSPLLRREFSIYTLWRTKCWTGTGTARSSFQHVSGTRSVAALALRGREYPLELSGTAWIDPETGVIGKIVADVGDTMRDVGLNTLRSEVYYAPVPFRGTKQTYWFPSQASVEVETPRQHWRNIHAFTDYKRFSVDTEEQVANQ